MNQVISNKELWNLPNEQIAKMTKGRRVRIVLKNGDIKEVDVNTILAAANPPNLFSGFLTMDNQEISLPTIDYVVILVNDVNVNP